MASVPSLFQGLQKLEWGYQPGCISSGCLGREEFASGFAPIIDRIHFFVAAGLRTSAFLGGGCWSETVFGSKMSVVVLSHLAPLWAAPMWQLASLGAAGGGEALEQVHEQDGALQNIAQHWE